MNRDQLNERLSAISIKQAILCRAMGYGTTAPTNWREKVPENVRPFLIALEVVDLPTRLDIINRSITERMREDEAAKGRGLVYDSTPTMPDRASELKEADRFCTCCERKLRGDIVWLELDQRDDTYHDLGDVPEDKSQGWFIFGPACARKKKATARTVKAAAELGIMCGQNSSRPGDKSQKNQSETPKSKPRQQAPS